MHYEPAGEDLTVIIPAAGLGRRMKSYGPKALIELKNGETVISRQLELLRGVLPYADIVVVLGFESDKIQRVLPDYVRVVKNEHYETTNVSRSLELGMRASRRQKALVVYGDLVFNENTLVILRNYESSVVVCHNCPERHGEVGVNVVDDKVTTFSYGLPTKWAHIALLCQPELRLFKKAASDRMKRKYFGYEVLNEVLDGGGRLSPLISSSIRIAEIDSSKDIENARNIF